MSLIRFDKKRRLLAMFLVLSGLAFAGASYWLSDALVRLVFWTIANCGSDSRCQVAIWLIDYWWLPFLAAVLAAACLAHWSFQRLARRIPEA